MDENKKMDQNEYKETIVKDRQQKRTELPQTRDLRRYIKRKDMQPKKEQLSNLHYELKKFKKTVALLTQKLDAFDRRLIEMEDFIVKLVEKEEGEKIEE